MAALHMTLQTFTAPEYKINPTTSLIVINDMMGLVKKYGAMVCGFTELADGDESIELRKLAMLVVNQVLTLDCKAISTEYSALQQENAMFSVVRETTRKQSGNPFLVSFDQEIWSLQEYTSSNTCSCRLDELYPASKKAALKRTKLNSTKTSISLWTA